jgi:hypothetical protein
MRTIPLAVIVLIVAALEAKADLSVKDYKAGMASRNEDEVTMTRIYIRAAGDGIVSANAQAEINKTPIFCQPNKLALGTENYLSILESTIKMFSAKAPRAKVDEMSAVLLLLRGLQDTFPCVRK